MRATALALGLCLLPACGPPPPACPPEPSTPPPSATPAAGASTTATAPTAAPTAASLDGRFVRAAASYAKVQRAKVRTDATGAVSKLALYHEDAAQVPDRVRTLTTETFPGSEIGLYELELYRDHGWVYEVKVKTADGKSCEIAVLERGTLHYQECEISVAEIPPAITKAIDAKLPGARILGAEAKKGPSIDEIHVKTEAGGRKHYLHFKPTGELLAHLLEIPATLEVPAP